AREFQQFKAEETPLPTAQREFRRTERMLVRFRPFGQTAGDMVIAARLLNKQGQKMSDLPVAPPATEPDARQVDLPLSSLPAGEYLLELSATSGGQEPATELVPFRVTG
ncbi:MAG: hypothetical protein IT178_16160, partial [Acidobacteria bacterium]|nr:hypothetical protein [Acidobacteriota bacterium]